MHDTENRQKIAICSP